MNNVRKSEQGQALVFLVIGFVVFLGFVALAIDGGMVYADRRHAQNSSDASSLAGGGTIALELENANITYGQWNCSNSAVLAAMALGRNASVARAASNSFTIDQDPSDNNGVDTTCGEFDYGYLDRFIDVHVVISSTTDTSFAQLLFPASLNNVVNAVTRVRPRMPVAYGHAIVALNSADCSGNQNGASFGGSSTISVNGGGIWTNGCLRGNGNSYTGLVTNGGVNYAGSTTGDMNFTPPPDFVPNQLPPSAYSVPEPNCSDPAAHNISAGSFPEEPDAGLWCLTGDLRINANDRVVAEGVTIYMLDGDVRINGGSEVRLSAPPTSPDPSPAIGGLLFYVPNGDVEILGNNESWYLGLIYVPNGNIDLSGTSGTHPTFHTQLVGWNVEVSGNADVDINFDAGEQYVKPASIELYR
jgi:hypothetical protein